MPEEKAKMNRCPRRFIHEEPEWWSNVMMGYQNFKSGFLPSAGGMDQQPTLFPALMALISQSADLEREAEEERTQRDQAAMNRQSKFNPAQNTGYAPINRPVKGR